MTSRHTCHIFVSFRNCSSSIVIIFSCWIAWTTPYILSLSIYQARETMLQLNTTNQYSGRHIKQRDIHKSKTIPKTIFECPLGECHSISKKIEPHQSLQGHGFISNTEHVPFSFVSPHSNKSARIFYNLITEAQDSSITCKFLLENKLAKNLINHVLQIVIAQFRAKLTCGLSPQHKLS